MAGTIFVSVILFCIIAGIIYSLTKKTSDKKSSCHCSSGCSFCNCSKSKVE